MAKTVIQKYKDIFSELMIVTEKYSIQVVEELNYNYAEKLIWVAQDIDLHCVYMCFIQLNLTGVAAIIQHSNSLSVEVFESFYTAAYLLNNCKTRLENRFRENKTLKTIREIEKDNKDKQLSFDF